MAKLLIVEPDADRFAALRPMLDFAGHTAEMVPDASSALDYLTHQPAPEAILSNLLLQGGDGFALCRDIKRQAVWASIPVLLVAEPDSDPADENLARRAGASGVLRRPFQRDMLLAEIDRAMLMASVQENPLQTPNPAEEIAFLRDHNQWLGRMLYRTHRSLQRTRQTRDLHSAHVDAVHQVTTALGESLNLDDTAAKLVMKTAELLRAQAAALYVRAEDSDMFQRLHIAGFGVPTPPTTKRVYLPQDGLFSSLYDRDRALLCHEPHEQDSVQQTFGLDAVFHTVVLSPLVARGQLNGLLLGLRQGSSPPFSEADAAMLYSLAGAAGLALRSAQLFQDLAEAYEHLREMNRRRSEFVAITSHELRTPIAIMLGYASLLYDMEEDERKKEQLATIEKQANFLSGMVDALLNLHELSDPSAESVVLRCAPLRLDYLLQDALRITWDNLEEPRDVAVIVDCDAIEIEGDEVRLTLALVNLLDNAVKFSHNGGRVWVTVAQRPEGGVVMTFEDEGIGIAPEYLPHLSEPFFQVEPAMTRHHGGLGLGLTIVKGMLDLHGATIEIISRPEEGSRVIITLPAKPPKGRCY